MSVTLYGPDKFGRIYSTLIAMDNDVVGAITLHDEKWVGFNDPIKKNSAVRTFVQDLKRSNAMTWNSQYLDEQVKLEADGWTPGKPYQSMVELAKSLRGLRYNLYDNGGKLHDLNDCYRKLRRLIDAIQSFIVSELPEWDAADTW